jgi:hypothetical protein
MQGSGDLLCQAIKLSEELEGKHVEAKKPVEPLIEA